MFDKLKEKCAVVGVFGCENASKLAYFSLFSMQHRGQEAAGISVSNGEKLKTIKNRGLVSEVFDDRSFEILKANIAIGHTRYSTVGDDSILDAQPVTAKYSLGEIAIVHNGNLTNSQKIREQLIDIGSIFQTYMDTENLIHLIAKSKEKTFLDRVINAVKTIQGAFSLIFLSEKYMCVVRDAQGFRPLSLAKIGDGYVVASETCAFDVVGASYIRDVAPGEMLIFEEGIKEPKSIQILEPKTHHCIFEYIYFARPDSNIYGKNVYQVRKKMGVELAKEKPVKADIVVPVPDSGVPAALGYSKESSIPFEMGIIRSHYVGRTFIEPSQDMRNLKVKMKLNPIKHLIRGKSLVVVDDSIIRGTTSRRIVRMLRDAGAKEVHMRISSPPTSNPCYYGIDTPEKSQLIAAKMSVDEICKYIEADTLAYISIDGLNKSIDDNKGYCKACFDGNYIV